jgi:hypothetical protein
MVSGARITLPKSTAPIKTKQKLRYDLSLFSYFEKEIITWY